MKAIAASNASRLAIAIAWLVFAMATIAADAQQFDTERVRQLYDSADYEQALQVLGSNQEPEAQQYRALCFLALGRADEAEIAVRTLVSASPDTELTGEDLPPRFVALVTRVRAEVLPAILRQRFAEAREQFQANSYDRAVTSFEKLLALSDAPDVRHANGIEDLRLLAAGFLDLAKAVRQPASAPPAATAAARRSESVSAATRPIMRRQSLPPWPVEAGRPVFQPTGSVRLRISREGRVTSAVMIKGLHPSYDRRVIAAALEWEYAPATLNGVPVESESVVEIRVDLPAR
jgi:tetratricopeptide (TPR) repeat protein